MVRGASIRRAYYTTNYQVRVTKTMPCGCVTLLASSLFSTSVLSKKLKNWKRTRGTREAGFVVYTAKQFSPRHVPFTRVPSCGIFLCRMVQATGTSRASSLIAIKGKKRKEKTISKTGELHFSYTRSLQLYAISRGIMNCLKQLLLKIKLIKIKENYC